METLSIRIKIGDREYPMKVKADEEARIRRVGKLINDKIKKYREEFGLEDRQDLLAMVAFDCMVESMELNEDHTEGSEQVKNVILQVNQRLEAIL
ncbi:MULTISPECIES: cell division protein ZapA [Cyclobacterium]|uniref:Cell division protein ZapA n=1 Tax=Cyclobacterium plantarum TaxID=2716263 RepID=A0ABX0H230_9BACT|nr:MULTISPECIES: cell division protein ZapA [Cyclobacterium]MBD3630204.1 cell division protein ZapA [Cyclobacterium sp.]NHE55512.1 cell division protein ZapA [Cyclobacterium plantarum]